MLNSTPDLCPTCTPSAEGLTGALSCSSDTSIGSRRQQLYLLVEEYSLQGLQLESLRIAELECFSTLILLCP